MRNLLTRVPKAQQSRVAAAIREVFVQPTHEKARDLWRTIATSAHNSLPKLAQAMDEAEEAALAYMTFPNETSILRLIGAVLLEANDE